MKPASIFIATLFGSGELNRRGNVIIGAATCTRDANKHYSRKKQEKHAELKELPVVLATQRAALFI